MNYCLDPISQIFTLILLTKEGPFKGKLPESWKVEFPSIFTETEAERVQVRTAQAQVDQIYINLGVLAPTEVRSSRFNGPEYSTSTELDEDVTEQMTVQADLAFEMQLRNYQAQQQQEALQASMGMPPGAGNENPADEGAPSDAPAPDAAGDSPNSTEGPSPEGDEGSIVLPELTKTDAFDYYGAHGLRIRVTSERNDCKIGVLCGPDGQRIDSADPTLMVFGPNRTRAYKLYRSRFECDGLLKDGPYVTGFARMKAAKAAVSTFFPGQNMVGLSPIGDAETEALRAGWGTY